MKSKEKKKRVTNAEILLQLQILMECYDVRIGQMERKCLDRLDGRLDQICRTYLTDFRDHIEQRIMDSDRKKRKRRVHALESLAILLANAREERPITFGKKHANPSKAELI